jgi:hypothetical protein
MDCKESKKPKTKNQKPKTKNQKTKTNIHKIVDVYFSYYLPWQKEKPIPWQNCKNTIPVAKRGAGGMGDVSPRSRGYRGMYPP